MQQKAKKKQQRVCKTEALEMVFEKQKEFRGTKKGKIVKDRLSDKAQNV